MKRWLSTLAVFAVCSAVVRADVTIVQTMTIEGGMAAMTGQTIAPKTTTRIKGLKSRTDMEMPPASMSMSTIADLVAKQITILATIRRRRRSIGARPPRRHDVHHDRARRHRHGEGGRDGHPDRQVPGHRRLQVRRVHVHDDHEHVGDRRRRTCRPRRRR